MYVWVSSNNMRCLPNVLYWFHSILCPIRYSLVHSVLLFINSDPSFRYHHTIKYCFVTTKIPHEANMMAFNMLYKGLFLKSVLHDIILRQMCTICVTLKRSQFTYYHTELSHIEPCWKAGSWSWSPLVLRWSPSKVCLKALSLSCSKVCSRALSLSC